MSHIKFLGHATVGIYANDGASMVIDPYEHGLFGGRFGYAPIQEVFDCAISTHDHLDHASTDALPGEPARGPVPPFEVTRVRLDHDEFDGRRRGGSVDAVLVEWDGLRLVHLSDVGHSPTLEAIQSLKSPDILLVPIGGFYTIGAAQAMEWIEALHPEVSIPIHYKTDVIALPLRELDVFLAQCGTCSRISSSEFEPGRSVTAPIVTLEPELA